VTKSLGIVPCRRRHWRDLLGVVLLDVIRYLCSKLAMSGLWLSRTSLAAILDAQEE
jgi:hypothetical protein